MQMINTANLNEARRQIQILSCKGEKDIAVLGQNDEFNRKILENKKVRTLILNEDKEVQDYMKQRNSGLNEIMCRLARDNGIQISVDIHKIIRKKKAEQAKSLARLAQNIMLCKKTGANLVFFGKLTDKKALFSLLILFGASTSQAKKTAEERFFN